MAYQSEVVAALTRTMSDVEVKELVEGAPIDHGTSKLGANGTLLGTIVSMELSVQSSTPEGHVGTASTAPDRPCTKPENRTIDKLPA